MQEHYINKVGELVIVVTQTCTHVVKCFLHAGYLLILNIIDHLCITLPLETLVEEIVRLFLKSLLNLIVKHDCGLI